MIADCNERQEARREVTTARALMKPTETNLIGDLVGALLSVFFLCGARCTCIAACASHHRPWELLPVRYRHRYRDGLASWTAGTVLYPLTKIQVIGNMCHTGAVHR